MTLILGILLGLFVLGLLVVIHELGHAIVARRNGVVVEEFGISFRLERGKEAEKWRIIYAKLVTNRRICQTKGEHDSAKGEGSYGLD